jgi:hypothetical protein
MMMKKVLILLMILGFGSLANGDTVLSWSVDAVTLDINETVNVTLDADVSTVFDSKKWVGNTAGTIAEIVDITARAAAGDDYTIENPATTGYPGWWTVFSKDFESPFNLDSGPQYDVTIKGLVAGTYSLDSDDYGGSDNDILEITVVPEPITIALLGLGGLLLRRRK